MKPPIDRNLEEISILLFMEELSLNSNSRQSQCMNKTMPLRRQLMIIFSMTKLLLRKSFMKTLHTSPWETSPRLKQRIKLNLPTSWGKWGNASSYHHRQEPYATRISSLVEFSELSRFDNSIALSEEHQDDEDHGEWLFYTGSSGRDLSGNKRTTTNRFLTIKLLRWVRLWGLAFERIILLASEATADDHKRCLSEERKSRLGWR